MGVNRIMAQQIFQIQNEFGPSGQPVWGTPNDQFNQRRFVGNWLNQDDTNGPSFLGASVNDFLEITFFGTGLNLVTYSDSSGPDNRVSVDGGAEGANILIATSNVLATRNYAQNIIVNAASGLALGIHTVRVRMQSQFLKIYGFEILTETTSLRVAPGVSFINGQKEVLSALQTIPYNTGFELGTLGTRGGRVVVYQKNDGTIAKAVRPVGAQANLSSADHANEELIRTYNFREFGAGRADDFSRIIGLGANSYAFTLDDNTTTLTMTTGASGGVGFVTPKEAIQPAPTATTNFIEFTFIGTGLDIVGVGDGGSRNFDVVIDGSNIGSLVLNAGVAARILKVVSGLPYGTHSVRFVNTGSSFGIADFIVYGPKKPTIPSSAIELADYNIMADYVGVANTVGANDPQIGTGVLRKMNTREMVYSGTYTFTISTALPSGFANQTAGNGSFYEYTFFGTGFELLNTYSSTPNNVTVQIATAKSLAGASTWTPGTSTWLVSGSTAARLQVTGLALGVHKVRVTKASATDFMVPLTIDVITPIHSAKSNVFFGVHNSLAIGSQAISDNRVFTPVKDVGAQSKSSAKARGVTASPTTTSTAFVPMPDMSLIVKSEKGGLFKVSANINWRNSAINNYGFFQIYVDGVPFGLDIGHQTYAATADEMSYITDTGYLGAGVHKVDIYWRTNAGTLTAQSIGRSMTVEET
jgi:hypothetical protein